MPTYAGTPYRSKGGQLVLFQIKSKTGASPFYYRINLPEQRRIESLVANAFKGDAPRYASLRQAFPCSEPCNPPAFIIDAANQIYDDMRLRMIRGEPIAAPGSRTLVDACKGRIQESEKDLADGIGKAEKISRRKRFYERFVYPYPPFAQPVTEITSTILKEWQKWRDRYWISGDGKNIEFIECERNGKPHKKKITQHERRNPALSTKNSEWVHLKAGFDWAAGNGWIDADHIPKHKFRALDAGDATTNPAFTAAQWKSLEEKSSGWINQEKLRGDNKRTRQLCWWFSLVCRAYGLRVAECYNLKRRHIVITDDGVGLSIGAIKTRASGKHQRTVEPIYRFRKQMFDLFTKYLPAFYEKEYGKSWEMNDPVWRHSNGKPFHRFNRGFDSLLKFAGITFDPQGHNYNLTSLRHTAITEEIETSTYSTGLIAVWAGTSSVMIDKHYNQAIMNRAKLQERKGTPPGVVPLNLLSPGAMPGAIGLVKDSVEASDLDSMDAIRDALSEPIPGKSD